MADDLSPDPGPPPDADPTGGAADVDRADLPLPDYDHLTLPALEHRIRSLDAGQVEALVAYELAHGDRVPVLSVLGARLDQLRSGATPSGGSPFGRRPEAAPAPDRGSAVTPATAGPPVNPPSHGDPTNPTQPRSTG